MTKGVCLSADPAVCLSVCNTTQKFIHRFRLTFLEVLVIIGHVLDSRRTLFIKQPAMLCNLVLMPIYCIHYIMGISHDIFYTASVKGRQLIYSILSACLFCWKQFKRNIRISSCEKLHVDNRKNAKSSDNTMNSKGYEHVYCLQSVLQYYWRGRLVYWSKVSPSVCILKPIE